MILRELLIVISKRCDKPIPLQLINLQLHFGEMLDTRIIPEAHAWPTFLVLYGQV